MIALIDAGDPRLASAPGEPCVLAAIQGLAKTAGPGLRREFWLALDGDSRPAGAVCRTEGGVWATATAPAAQETAAFLSALGALPGTVDSVLGPFLPGDWRRCPVLEYRGALPVGTPCCTPSAMALVECNISAGAIPPGDRDALYAELHLRLRRGAAQVFLAPDGDGKPAAGAATLLGEGHAVIGWLACRREKQGRGHGTAALLAAVRGAMEQRKIPLLACREELAAFYIARGFFLAGEVWERGALLSR